MGNDLFVLMDLLIPVFGLYALYAAYELKKEGKIVETFLLYKGAKAEQCRDLEGYADYMAPRLRMLGGVLIAYGAVALLNDFFVKITGLFLLMIAVFVAALIAYGLAAKKAMQIYFE